MDDKNNDRPAQDHIDPLTIDLPTLEEMNIRPEILEAAEEIADSSDVPGVEQYKLERLVRLVIYLDRQQRTA